MLSDDIAYLLEIDLGKALVASTITHIQGENKLLVAFGRIVKEDSELLLGEALSLKIRVCLLYANIRY